MMVLLVFIFGLFFGSFLNVAICRFPDWQAVILRRSHCPRCKKKLPWYDLIPLFSFIAVLGKCRFCGKTISWQYPIVELATALIWLGIYLKFGFGIGGILILLSLPLIFAATYDWLHSIIPDSVTGTATGISLFFALKMAIGGNNFLSPLLALIIGLGFIALLVLLGKGRWMGMGDLKLVAPISLMSGYPGIIVSLFFAFFLGAIVSLILIALKKKTLKDQIPFGPFLVTAGFISLFWGKEISGWYLF